MAAKWFNTVYPGVRFRKHSKRKHKGKFDRYFTIRYYRDRIRIEEGVGWSSEDMNAKKASEKLAELNTNYREGKSPTTLAEKRELERKRKKLKAVNNITFGKLFTDNYYPQAKNDKGVQSCKREQSLYIKWINPVIGTLPLRQIAPIHLEKIKKNMRDAGLADRSMEYALAVIRQVFNYAFRNDLFSGDNPVKKVKIPKSDNKRLKFLTRDEAEKLLNALKAKSQTVWEQALISLHTGLRAGEIFRLTWADVNIDRGTLTVDGKNKKTRHAYMTSDIKTMLLNKKSGKPSARLYPAINEDTRQEISKTFKRVVQELKLNDGIEDRRDKVVFHTLRHTYASWLVQNGTDLYVVKDRLGHSTLAMTERYAHLAPKNSQRTVATLENFLSQSEKIIYVDERNKR